MLIVKLYSYGEACVSMISVVVFFVEATFVYAHSDCEDPWFVVISKDNVDAYVDRALGVCDTIAGHEDYFFGSEPILYPVRQSARGMPWLWW